MLSILVVDDDSMVSNVLQLIVTRIGHHAEIALGGHEGLRMFDDKAYDLVITDMLMPSIDGLGVAMHIRRSDRPNTPIIGISGTPWLLENKIFDSVIPKPFNIQTLAKAISRVTAYGLTTRALAGNEKNSLALDNTTSPLIAT